MTIDWNPRADILQITHRWYLPFFAFLIGSILGIGISLLLPSPYRAESTLYVAYNADAIYRNPDDYKNWQLGELEAFILSEYILQETLTRLQANDSYWESISTEGLRSMLHAYWRNAGKWRLVAENPSPQHATQLVQVWREVILEKGNEATTHGVAMLDLSAQLQAVSKSDVEVKMRFTQLSQMKEAFLTLQTQVIEQKDQQSLKTLERWYLQTLSARTASFNPIVLPLLEEIPPLDAPARDYSLWIEKIIVVLDSELAIVQEQTAELATDHEELTQSWDEASDRSFGLTAYLIIEPLSDTTAMAKPVRLTSQMALVGGLLGVLIWGYIWLGRPIREAKE